MNKISMRVRLLLLLGVPLLVFVYLSLYLMDVVDKNTNRMTEELHDTTFEIVTLTLNADRDLYQAMTASLSLVAGAADKDKQQREFADNLQQARDRAAQSLALMQRRGEQLTGLKHDPSGMTAQAAYEQFRTNEQAWTKAREAAVAAGTVDWASIGMFDEAREALNILGEIVEQFAAVQVADIREENDRVLTVVLIVLIALALLLGGAGYWTIRQITVSTRRVVADTQKVAEGDLRETLTYRGGKDELARIALALDEMRSRMRGMLREISDNAHQVQTASGSLITCSGETAAASEHIALNVQEVTQHAETQARMAEETSRAIGEMTMGVQRIAEASSRISELSGQTMDRADRGGELIGRLDRQVAGIGETVERLSQTVESLHRRSGEIGQIVAQITSFAKHTNILSLNASIEAARAGEQGRGFAVVAGEIHKLATQSGESASRIEAMIAATQAEIESAREQMQLSLQSAQSGQTQMADARGSFTDILESVRQITGQIHETSAVTQQMSASSEQVSASTEQTSHTARESFGRVQSVAAAVEQQLASMQTIAAAAEQLGEVADKLLAAVGRFRLDGSGAARD